MDCLAVVSLARIKYGNVHSRVRLVRLVLLRVLDQISDTQIVIVQMNPNLLKEGKDSK